MTRSTVDECIFYHKDKGIIMAIYVDDYAIGTASEESKKWIEDKLVAKFDIKLEGPLKKYLGLRYRQTEKGLFADQEVYVKQLMEDYSLGSEETAPTPYMTKIPFKKEDLTKDREEVQRLYEDNNVNLPTLVGSLLHLARCTRPDIAVAVSKLGSHVSYCSKEVIEYAKHVLKYLNGTRQLGVHLSSSENDNVTGWVDASFMQDKEHHGHSRYGYALWLGHTLLDWKSALLTGSPSTSTTTAEYQALAIASSVAKYAQLLNEEIRETFPMDIKPRHDTVELSIARKAKGEMRMEGEGQTKEPVIMMEDNQPAIDAVQSNRGAALKTRTIATYYHSLRHDYDTGQVHIARVPSERQMADFFTKTTFSTMGFRTWRQYFVRTFEEQERPTLPSWEE